jgi:hypothetical protein
LLSVGFVACEITHKFSLSQSINDSQVISSINIILLFSSRWRWGDIFTSMFLAKFSILQGYRSRIRTVIESSLHPIFSLYIIPVFSNINAEKFGNKNPKLTILPFNIQNRSFRRFINLNFN